MSGTTISKKATKLTFLITGDVKKYKEDLITQTNNCLPWGQHLSNYFIRQWSAFTSSLANVVGKLSSCVGDSQGSVQRSLTVPWSLPWVRFQAQTAFHETKSCSRRVSRSDGCHLAELTSAPCCSPLLPPSVAGMGPKGKDPRHLNGAWRTDIPRTQTPPRILTRATLYLDSIRPWNFSPLLGNLVPLNYMASFFIPCKIYCSITSPMGK